MIKIVFNFKCIYMYECVTCYFFFKNNLTNYLYFIVKIMFNFKCIHAFAWVTCLLHIILRY